MYGSEKVNGIKGSDMKVTKVANVMFMTTLFQK